ncbi:UNVERIFIED_CONTAM: Type IV inositol polyphosphate 5-phosphatase 3 [Sesamum radiatum]|uniref:Type IV inositol polyphosphate 5-phosphatase 3 n=1 Tax=Sesamum radiatum TaxID=300843 RepID=A0AAW2M3G4_SESRA
MKKENVRNHHQQTELSWRRVVVRKWFNIANSNSDYSADTDSDSDSDTEICDWLRESRFKNEKPDGVQVDADDALPRLRRRNSETFRAQYINKKEIKICAATWNVGGRVPPEDLDLDGWLDVDDPADIYVIGLQEIIPLNAGNIFGAEDSRPVSVWENIIRENLSQVPPTTKFKSYSDPPSPSRFKPSEDAPVIEDEILLESDSDIEEEIHPLNEELNGFGEIKDVQVKGENFLCADTSVSNDYDNSRPLEQDLQRQFSSPKKLARLNCLRTDDSEENVEAPNSQHMNKLTKTLSGTERIGLSWPELPLHLLPQPITERPNSFKSFKSFKSFQVSKSFKTYSSFKYNTITENRMLSDLASLAEVDLESLINRKRRPPYVRIVSKQMVGIFITIWVRRSLRRHIQNLNVSTVGVGVMGYIGNKGSISVSMSIHQTLFCFVCTHLTSGEKEADAIKRNADVHEIHRRTRFSSLAGMGLRKSIYDHECDRVLSYGTGMRLLSYRRSELKLSDHRPVTASYMVEVEVFSPRRLQRALTFTDAEIEEQDIVTEMGLGGGIGRLRSREVSSLALWNTDKS